MKVQCTECGMMFYRDSSSPTYTLCDKCYKELVESGTPIAPVAATASLEFTGEVFDGETISLGQNTYEFDIGGTVRPGNILIDISGDAVAATGDMTATAPGLLGEKIVIDEEEYILAETDGDNDIDISGGTKTKAENTLTLAGDIVPGVHAETVLTSNGTTPAVLTAASKDLTISGGASDGETITIGGRVYELDIDDSITEGSVKVDISAGTKTQATTVLTLEGAVKDGEIFTIGEETYEIDTDDNVTEGNIAVDVSAYATAAQGTLTVTGGGNQIAEGYTVTIDGKTYTFKTSLTVEAVEGEVLIGANDTAALLNLLNALNHTGTPGTDYSCEAAHPTVKGSSSDATTLVAEARTPGTAGNAIEVSEEGAETGWDNTVLGTTQAGADCTAANADGVIITVFETETAYDITASQGEGTSVDFNADIAGGQDGSAGNVATTETLSAGSFTGSTMTGGVDASDAEAAAALISAIDGDTSAVVDAADGGAGVVSVEALEAGASGNSISIAETMAHGSWTGAATELSGGLDADTVTIGEITYTFVGSLSDPEVAYEVATGISAATALDNLKSAINETAGKGSTYSTGTVAHPIVVATDNDDTTQKIVARIPGATTNNTVTTETSDYLSWEDTTLGGGTGASVAGVTADTVTFGDATYSFVTALSETSGADAIVNQILFGANSAEALDNLALTLNHGATEGTNYSTGTVVDPLIEATTNTDTSQKVIARTAGSVGNSIGVSTTISDGSFDGDNLAGGTDATADEIVAAAVVTINAKEGEVVSATDETGGVLRLTAVTAGVAGNEITTTTDITGASFAEENLTGGTDAGAPNAVTATVAAINGNTSEKVTAIDDDGDVVTITAKTIGTYGNYILLESTCENASWDGSKMTGGVNGSPALRDQIVSDKNYLHISYEPSTYQKSKWKKTDLT